MQAQDHPNEAARLASLNALHLLDTQAHAAWDRIATLAARICETPIALVSLIDDHRQWFKAREGLDAQETPKDQAFCAHAILEKGIFTVPDASQDPRFADNPLVTDDPSIRFYAGTPIHAPDGNPIGTVCVIDRVPRELTGAQERVLKLIGEQAETMLKARATAQTLESYIGTKETDKLMDLVDDQFTVPLAPFVVGIQHLIPNPTPEIQRLITQVATDIADLGTRMNDALSSVTDFAAES